MRRRCIPRVATGALATLAAAATIAYGAREPKPWPQWTRKDIQKILYFSPWVSTQSEVNPNSLTWVPINAGSYWDRNYIPDSTLGQWDASEDEVFTVQFRSALPMRQALARLRQINYNYEKMTPQEREAFDREHDPGLTPGGEVVLNVDIRSSRQGSPMNLTLIMSNGTRISPLRTAEFQSFGGTNYIFPRVVEGQPIVGPSDKKVVVEFQWFSVTKRFTFKVSRMTYNGRLEY